MGKEHYYVYCQGVLGVKTNMDDFRWVYGSKAPDASYDEYEKCKVKFDLCTKPEKNLTEVANCDKKFQSYFWNAETKTISCRRTILRGFKIGFNIRIVDNTIFAEMGKNYYKYIRNRTMNLHGMYYLLSDLANVMLLKNGFLSLYASAVYNEQQNKCIVCFAPPNTGKTVTATKLCELPVYRFIGEDIAITDGKTVYSCPWTNSYRTNSKMIDSAGSISRLSKNIPTDICNQSNLTNIAVLSLGHKKISDDKEEIYKQICMLNGYLFGYYSTPIIKILAYFDEDYRNPWNEYSSSMLKNMVDMCDCRLIQVENPNDFFDIIGFEWIGEQA